MATHEFHIEGLYDGKWETIETAEDRETAEGIRNTYDTNEPEYTHRIRKRAVPDPAAPSTYQIVRSYQDRGVDSETVVTGLTLAEAQTFCKDPESSSSTATQPEAVARTSTYGPWFNGYREE